MAEQMGQQHAALYTAAHDGAEHRCRCQEGGRGQRDRELLLGARHQEADLLPTAVRQRERAAAQCMPPPEADLPPLLCATEA